MSCIVLLEFHIIPNTFTIHRWNHIPSWNIRNDIFWNISLIKPQFIIRRANSIHVVTNIKNCSNYKWMVNHSSKTYKNIHDEWWYEHYSILIIFFGYNIMNMPFCSTVKVNDFVNLDAHLPSRRTLYSGLRQFIWYSWNMS